MRGKNKTNMLIGTTPLFDHGNALFYQAYGDDWASDENSSAYAATQDACLCGDFFECTKSIMTHETKSKVRSMLTLKFTRKPAKGFPKERLQRIETQI